MREGHVEGQTGEVRPTGSWFLIYSMVDFDQNFADACNHSRYNKLRVDLQGSLLK